MRTLRFTAMAASLPALFKQFQYMEVDRKIKDFSIHNTCFFTPPLS
jgi:hypothetical protein